MVQKKSETLPKLLSAEVLLPLHLRILLQPLRDDRRPDRYTFQLLIDDWRRLRPGVLHAGLLANAYLNLYGRLRLDIQQAKVEIKTMEKNHGVKPE